MENSILPSGVVIPLISFPTLFHFAAVLPPSCSSLSFSSTRGYSFRQSLSAAFAHSHLPFQTSVTLCSHLPIQTVNMRFSVAALVSAFAAVAAAYTSPDYSKAPQGNAIRSPTLNEQVPEGKPYTIKWDHDLGKTVSIVLLRGPSTNVVPIQTLAESIPNSGEFSWTPSTTLTPDVTHYGLLIVVEDSGVNHAAYQWSTQFGLSKAEGSITTAITTSLASQTTAASSYKHTIVTIIDNVTTTYCAEDKASSSLATQSTSAVAPSNVITSWEVTTTVCPETTTAPVGTPVASSTEVGPVGSGTLTSTPYVQPTSNASATSTPAFNAAGRNVISFGVVVAGLVAFMAL
jgi:hypothetical protein